MLQISVFNAAPPLTTATGSLVTFSAGMPTNSPLDNLNIVLIDGESKLNSAPYASATGSTYSNWLTTLR
jgi:hypothetical protein